MRRSALLFAVVGVGLILTVGTARAHAQSASLEMTAAPERVLPGEPVSFTITKTNLVPSDLEWSVRDFLPASTEFVSANSSQGSCALASREELGIPYNPTNGYDSDVVQCDLGVIPSGGLATIDVTVTPTIPGEITNYAADTGESQASATVEVVEHH